MDGEQDYQASALKLFHSNDSRWHLLTGIGVYHYILLIEYLRLYLKSTNDDGASKVEIILVQKSRFSLQFLEITQGRKERIS
jgi:hypothetical protein